MSKKNVNNDVLLDCWSCSNSQAATHPYKGKLIVCSLTMGLATKRCNEFDYCPGSDADQHE